MIFNFLQNNFSDVQGTTETLYLQTQFLVMVADKNVPLPKFNLPLLP